MSSEPPPGAGQQPPDDDDPFKKRQPPPSYGAGDPYDNSSPAAGGTPPEGGGDPYAGSGRPAGGSPYGGGGGDPYGGAADPLAGMPPLADGARRVIARIIDIILVGIVVWLLTWGFNVHEYDVDSDDINYGRSAGQSLIAAVLYIAYDTILMSRTGQTLGKRWLRLRLANLDNGDTPSAQTVFVRSLVLWIPFAFCCACIWTAIAGGWSFFDKPYKQGLHDKAAKTVVVSTG
ncbi:RDD family protein [Streptomyces sp. ME02-8801-2C]|uniref:RDD family protein n=1 Tax=Streptomyces sp. ME02-8801-2C TaxID=3028680 RepID=UPI0029A75005|nr:RDD family protein [Streptomyces sp. ME02-8801-2C]MDX3454459.1 RDD family protein [Streptomyces sp. ME02-8801-2C]